MTQKTTAIIENLIAKAEQAARAKEYATFEDYQTLAKLLEERGTMPQDIAPLCNLLYRRQYATLSHDNAQDLMARIANVPADQGAMRFWISNTVTGMMSGWVNEGKEA